MPKATKTAKRSGAVEPSSRHKESAEATMPKGRVGKYFHAIGKRKTAIASVRLYEKGTGSFIVNGKKMTEFINGKDFEEIAWAPLRAVHALKSYDIQINVAGGGHRAQVDAIKHGISRALTKADIMLRPTLKKAGFLTRDPRIKERKKPGLKSARRAPQWSKR